MTLIFPFMTMGGPNSTRARFLAFFAFGCAAVALALRYGMTHRWGDDLLVTGIAMTLIWFGWISVWAFGVLALRCADSGLFMPRITAVIGSA
jgi:hypothetical protein